MSLKVVCMMLAEVSLQAPFRFDGLQTDGALVVTHARVHCHVAPKVTS